MHCYNGEIHRLNPLNSSTRHQFKTLLKRVFAIPRINPLNSSTGSKPFSKESLLESQRFMNLTGLNSSTSRDHPKTFLERVSAVLSHTGNIRILNPLN